MQTKLNHTQESLVLPAVKPLSHSALPRSRLALCDERVLKQLARGRTLLRLGPQAVKDERATVVSEVLLLQQLRLDAFVEAGLAGLLHQDLGPFVPSFRAVGLKSIIIIWIIK